MAMWPHRVIDEVDTSDDDTSGVCQHLSVDVTPAPWGQVRAHESRVASECTSGSYRCVDEWVSQQSEYTTTHLREESTSVELHPASRYQYGDGSLDMERRSVDVYPPSQIGSSYQRVDESLSIRSKPTANSRPSSPLRKWREAQPSQHSQPSAMYPFSIDTSGMVSRQMTSITMQPLPMEVRDRLSRQIPCGIIESNRLDGGVVRAKSTVGNACSIAQSDTNGMPHVWAEVLQSNAREGHVNDSASRNSRIGEHPVAHTMPGTKQPKGTTLKVDTRCGVPQLQSAVPMVRSQHDGESVTVNDRKSHDQLYSTEQRGEYDEQSKVPVGPLPTGNSYNSDVSQMNLLNAESRQEIGKLELSQIQARRELEKQKFEILYKSEVLEAEAKIKRANIEARYWQAKRIAGENKSVDNYDVTTEDSIAYVNQLRPRTFEPRRSFETTHTANESMQCEYSDTANCVGYRNDSYGQDRHDVEHTRSRTPRSRSATSRNYVKHADAHVKPVERNMPSSRSKTPVFSSRNDRVNDTNNSNIEPFLYTNNQPSVPLDATLTKLLEQQQQIFASMASSIHNGINMPKAEILTFDGNPMNYWKFIQNFDANICMHVTDSRVRLNYLIQYCTGEAKESIVDCTVLDSGEGYRRAREILANRYGKPHVIAQAYINQLISGPAVKQSDSNDLINLASMMQKCEITLSSMGYVADLNNTQNLLQIVRRLPIHLRGKWAERADSIIEAGHEPTFKDLATFIDKSARIANTLYGKDMSKSQNRPTKFTTLITHDSSFDSNVQVHRDIPHEKCPHCHGTHPLWKCMGFQKLSLDNKLKVLMEHRLCNNCFLPGHIAKGCMQRSFCNIDGCRRKHHAFLHASAGGYMGDRYNSYPDTNKAHLGQWRDTPQSSQKADSHDQQSGNARLNSAKYNKQSRDMQAARPSTNYPGHTLNTVEGDLPSDMVAHTSDKSGTGSVSDTNPHNHYHCSMTEGESRKVCLKVVPVKVQAYAGGPSIETYALLDECSDVSLCDRKLAEQLGAVGVEKSFSITTVNKRNSELKGIEVKLSVTSLSGEDNVMVDKVWTVDQLPVSSKCIPTNDDVSHWPHLSGISFPEINTNDVTILIGSDVPDVFWVIDERRGKTKEPYAVRSILGWTLIGPVRNGKDNNTSHVNYLNAQDDIIHNQLRQLWNTDFNESSVTECDEPSVEDKRALALMNESVTVVDGHYQVSLPWRIYPPSLPSNRIMAEARLKMLKRRLLKDDEVLSKYKGTIEEYIRNGYAREVPEGEINNSSILWYIPHHPVINPRKPDKLRVVFDCAAKYNNVSLNDRLLQGPDLTNNLLGVLLRFRQGRVAMASDVEAMFHQVKVDPRDRDALRFLWWPHGDLTQEPTDHQMLVHLFGATSSPSICAFSLKKTAEDNQEIFDLITTETVMKNFYVDDCLKSVDSEGEAIRLAKDLMALLQIGGFRLTKWMSNSRNVLAAIPESERSKSAKALDLHNLQCESTLGVQWNVETDAFEIRIIHNNKSSTRRGILSVVSSLYDPLGMVAPVILVPKLLLQNFCKQKLGWDEPVGEKANSEWTEWIDSIETLSDVTLDRCFRSVEVSDVQVTQLHHFSDASEQGYGAVSYLRYVDVNGKITCSFVVGKARVAPLKSISIPRLELSAAVVAVNLDKMVKRELDVHIDETTFWTDSTVVLQYIANESRRFKTFVANRVTIIHDSSDVSQWRHVNSSNNPADHASRGIKPHEKSKLDMWLKGPSFLWKDESHWPNNQLNLPKLPDSSEVKRNFTINYVGEGSRLDTMFTSFSSYYKFQKSIAWLLRFKAYCCTRYLHRNNVEMPITAHLSIKELREATCAIVRYVQQQVYPDELKQLQTKQSVSVGSPLSKLSPMLVDGVIRVGGRIKHSHVDYETKHPMILPGNHHVTNLLIDQYHIQQGHSGRDHILAMLRKRFWITKGVASVKRVLGKCFSCKRRQAPPCEQMMGSLPSERVTADKPPFTFVGVDYFGPLYVKIGRSRVKRYGCLFTCLTTRAIHIEIVHTLETGSFISALFRFISRRGRPDKLFSDNGTCFHGADKELKESLRRWNQEQITDTLRQREVEWSFNPPTASHMGGVWERLIRSVRKVLGALVKEQVFTDESLLTFLAEVERIVNDRPLTVPSQDSNDLPPLTPNDLLRPNTKGSLPMGVFVETDRYSRRWWRQSQYLVSVFWKRWIKEYLPTLQERQKWRIPRRNLCINDIVLVMHEDCPRGEWPLGRVVETYPDSNGFVRSAKVKIGHIFKVRPVVKLCLLEGDID